MYNVTMLCTGPLPKTVVDFWRLIWQERPPTIVMVTNVKEGIRIKCQQYWPESGKKDFGPFQVTITDQQIFADYTIRTLSVSVRYFKILTAEIERVFFCCCCAIACIHWAFPQGDSIPLHCLAWSWSTRLCHTHLGLPQESEGSAPPLQGTHGSTLQVTYITKPYHDYEAYITPSDMNAVLVWVAQVHSLWLTTSWSR